MPMLFYCCGSSPALNHAVTLLHKAQVPFAKDPCEDVTHLLLPVPSFDADGSIKGAGALSELLSRLPKQITVIGGNLHRQELIGYQTIDLLRDDTYVTENASITAHCAIRLAMNHLPVTLKACPVLVIGWGRIGKCLAMLLAGLGARVTVAARKSADRAMAKALGYEATPIYCMDTSGYRVIFNTVPVLVLHDTSRALKIDLASKPGIDADDVLWARGLPGKDAPESSGTLIYETVQRLTDSQNQKGVQL